MSGEAIGRFLYGARHYMEAGSPWLLIAARNVREAKRLAVGSMHEADCEHITELRVTRLALADGVPAAVEGGSGIIDHGSELGQRLMYALEWELDGEPTCIDCGRSRYEMVPESHFTKDVEFGDVCDYCWEDPDVG